VCRGKGDVSRGGLSSLSLAVLLRARRGVVGMRWSARRACAGLSSLSLALSLRKGRPKLAPVSLRALSLSLISHHLVQLRGRQVAVDDLGREARLHERAALEHARGLLFLIWGGDVEVAAALRWRPGGGRLRAPSARRNGGRENQNNTIRPRIRGAGAHLAGRRRHGRAQLVSRAAGQLSGHDVERHGVCFSGGRVVVPNATESVFLVVSKIEGRARA
jgi:hypothetical protein